MPEFATRDYAYLPFTLVESSDEPAAKPTNRTWMADTVRYWTDLECYPAEIQKRGDVRSGYEYSDSNNCTITEYLAPYV